MKTPAVVIIEQHGSKFQAVQIINGRKVTIYTAAHETREAVKIETARKLGIEVVFI